MTSMSQMGTDKYFPGSVVVNKSVQTREVTTDTLNGKEIQEYITEEDIPNAPTLKDFKEEAGGLLWKGMQLIPPNTVMEDRPYTSGEIHQLIEGIWDKYDGSVDDEKVDKEVDTTPSGSIPTDWN